MIAKFFAPLAAGAPGAAGLADDVAILVPPGGGANIVTADAIVAGVHFLPEDPLAEVARKALRVNVSDIAAKGAVPYGYLLTLLWPRGRDVAAIADLASGLAADQALFGLSLLGGDTVATPGPLALSLTMFGTGLGPQAPIRRAGARVGDGLYVTGTIGDATLGLRALQGEDLGLRAAECDFLIARYRRPEPRLAFAAAIACWATASLDVSDGLVQDCGHLARQSGLGLEIRADELPLSPPARQWLDKASDPVRALGALASGGDDYEIAFAAPRSAEAELMAAAAAAGAPLARIGRFVLGAQIRLIGADNRVIGLEKPGFQHF